MAPMKSEQAYKEHMAVASRSMFPYMSKASSLVKETEGIRNTEGIDLGNRQIQSSDQGPASSMGDGMRDDPLLNEDTDMDIENVRVPSAYQYSRGQGNIEYVEGSDNYVIARHAGPCIPLRACALCAEAGVPRQTFLYARGRRCHSLPPEVDRMPFTTGIARVHDTFSRWGRKKNEESDEEEAAEARLLGATRHDDTGAFLIGKPTNRTMPAMPFLAGGGPRPINTLNKKAVSQASISRPVRNKTRGGEMNQLHCEISRGTNVKAIPHAADWGNEAYPLSPAKRQKTNHQASPPDSARSLDEILDGLDPDTVTFGPSPSGRSPAPAQSSSQAVSIRNNNSQTQNPYVQRISSLNHSQEHISVEKMMNSAPMTKKRQKRLERQQSGQQSCGLLSSSPVSSQSNTVDIMIEDQQSPDEWLATTHESRQQRNAGNIGAVNGPSESFSSKMMRGAYSGNQSPYFEQPGLPAPNVPGSNIRKKITANLKIENGDATDRLSKKFIPVHGDRRTSGVSMSSDLDELQSVGTTVGKNAGPIPSSLSKRSRNPRPSTESVQVSQSVSPDKEESELAQSNIKHSSFTNAGSRNQRNTRIVGGASEKKPPWSVGVRAVSTRGELYEVDGLGLVYDENASLYVVVREGKRTAIEIQPGKLQRILWELSGRKVRFTSSQSGTNDNIVDIEFQSEKDAQQLLKRIDILQCQRVEHRDGDFMSKSFEKRRSEFQRTGFPPSTDLLAAPEVLPAVESTSPHEIKTRHKTAKTKITGEDRGGRSLVSDLLEKAHRPDDAANERDRSALRNGIHHTRNVSQVLEKLKPNHNAHLERSRRVSARVRKPLQDVPDSDYMLPDYSRPDRYSEVYGLGTPWKKPLIYPNTGRKKATVEFSDLVRLDEGEYLNDSLIGFYLRFLEQTIEDQRPDLAKKVYFFNTFFYATLMNTHKGRKGFNYEGVQKWTRNVDLFAYNYIVVPINEETHWYLAIICNLPALERSIDASDEAPSSPINPAPDEGERISKNDSPPSSPIAVLPEGDSVTLVEDPKEPDERGARDSLAGLSLDVDAAKPSIADQGARIDDLAHEDQDILDEQLHANDDGAETSKPPNELPKTPSKSKKGKRKSMPPITKVDPSKPAIITFDSLMLSRSSTIRALKGYLREEAQAKRGGMVFDPSQIKGITANAIPEQANSYDCGVFLLGYVAKFLEDDPKDFITKVIQRKHDPYNDFPLLKNGRLRNMVREQVMKLHNEQTRERLKECEVQRAAKIAEKVEKSNPDAGKSSSHAVNQAVPTHPQSTDKEEETYRPIERAKDPSPPATRDDALKYYALDLPPYDFDGDVEAITRQHGNEPNMEAALQQDDQGDKREQANSISSTPNAPSQGQEQKSMPSVMIHSQSQEEVPQSFYQALPNGKTHGLPEPSPELPAEIKDSQPSETFKLFADVYHKIPNPIETSSRPHTRKRDLEAAEVVVIREDSRDMKRKKLEHENVAQTAQQKPQDGHAPKKTEERDGEVPSWVKQTGERSSRPKGYRKAEKGKEVINIDDD